MEFVDSLDNGQILREHLDELQQTVNLMQSDNHDEFFDISTRNKKYGRVDALNGPMLLEKYYAYNLLGCTGTKTTHRITPLTQGTGRSAYLGNLSTRFSTLK